MSYTTIQAALDTQLATVVSLPTLTTENTRYKAVNSVPFSRSTLLPARTQTETVGIHGYDRVNGLYQVDIFYPADGGYTDANTVADAVIASFGKGLQLTTTDSLKVDIEISWRLPARMVQNFYSVPVVVSWKSYIQS